MSDPTDETFIERRGEIRCAIETPISIRERGSHRIPATLLDLARGGCRVGNAVLSRKEGAEAFVRIPGLESLTATVAWRDGPVAGLRVQRPLHPAVYQRVMAIHRSGPAAEAVQPYSADREFQAPRRPAPPGSRRDQIVAGYTIPDPGMLLDKRPAEGGKSIMTLVRRNTARRADHRHEPRYPAPEATEVRVGDQALPAGAANLSASGVMVSGTPPQEIGDTVAVRFGDHEAIWGTVIWKRGGHFGLSLPPGSLELDAA